MDLKLIPSRLSGTLVAIPSKSDAHRLLICAALADAPTELILAAGSEDIDATISCLTALGAGIRPTPDGLLISPIRRVPEDPLLDCAESGSTLRFLLPVAAAIAPRARFNGRGRLPERPIHDLKTTLASAGIAFSADQLPFTISGQLVPGTFTVTGNVSSQYITGLLLAMAAMGGGSRLKLATALESAAYVDITRSALARFGVAVEATADGWVMPAGQHLHSPGRITVAGDWSNAGFWLTAGALGSAVSLTGTDPDSPQGDRHILDVLTAMGARVSQSADEIRVEPGDLTGTVIDVREIPDALPILAVAAAAARGETRFINAGRLRLKESDRLAAVAALLRDLGGQAEEMADGLIVRGGGLTGGTVDGCGDHRIVMAAAIAATICSQPVIITGAEAVRKSYPQFFDDYQRLGGTLHGL